MWNPFIFCLVWNIILHSYVHGDMWDDYLLEGYNLTSSQCLNSWTCADEDPEVMDLCYCDNLCHKFGDCCMDIETFFSQNEPLLNVDCEFHPNINERSFVYIISRCPHQSSSNIVRQRCETPDEEDIFERTPVSGETSGILYRNLFCAMCNHENYILWQAELDCGWKVRYTGDFDAKQLLSESGNCRIKFSPPTFQMGARSCMPTISNCAVSDDLETQSQCTNDPRSLVFVGQKVYKNSMCALCNQELKENITCIPDYELITNHKPDKRKNYNYSYRLLIDFNTLSSNEIIGTRRKFNRKEEDISKSCLGQMVYDPFAKVCRNLRCEAPFSYVDGKCVFQKTNKTKTELQAMNDTHKLLCPHVLLNKSEFRITNESNIIEISSGVIFSFSESFLGEDYALVCIKSRYNDTNDKQDESITLIFTSAESVLSIICESLSIICLFIGVSVYSCIPNLRNIPGRNLLCLMSSLLIAQLFFIAAPLAVGMNAICLLMAVIIHYFFLAAFFWMNIMAIDMFLTFTRGFMASRGESNKHGKRFIYYCLYAFVSPLVVIIVSLTLDFGSASDIRPKYGSIICWFGNDLGLLYLFLVPLFILLLMNTGCFVATARSIYTTDKSASKVLRQKRGCKLLIYLKLSVVMGLTWVFAGAAIFGNAAPLWILFIIFNGLQGVLIFFSFVCSRKIFRMVNKSYSSFSSRTRTFFEKHSINSSRHSSVESTKTTMSVISKNTIKPHGETSC